MKNIHMKTALGAVICASIASQGFADNASTFGPTQTTALTTGDSYAGITVTATDANNGSGGFDSYTTAVNLLDLNTTTGLWTEPVTFNIHTDQPTGFGPGGAEGFGSTLTFLAGEVSANTTVSVSVRKPNDNEVFGYSTTPPLNDSAGWSSLLSDVFQVTGVAGPGTVVDGKTQTDVFALQISYLDNNLANTNTTAEAYMEDYIYEHGYVKSWTETDIAAAGELQIAFVNTAGVYLDDDSGTINPGTTVVENYQGAWATFAAANGVTDANLSDFNGSWGVDTVNNNIWLITDHNTEFAVVPEPGTLAGVFLGMFLMTRTRRQAS